jgi:hypothetical protein
MLMVMQAIELQTEIDENGEIHLHLPATIKARKVRVIVLYEDDKTEVTATDDEDLLTFLENLNKGNWPSRDKADIDRYIDGERSGWE